MFNLKLEQVRAFLHVVYNEGNKKAANALHLTQPAITARIKNLEALLGTELFDRNSGSRKLSKRGEILLQYSDKLEHLVNQIEHDVADVNGVDRYLRIGVSETVAQSWMPKVLLELKSRFPLLEIELHIDISPRLLEMLDDCEIDIAIAHGTTGDQRMKRIMLPTIALAWFTSCDDPVGDRAAAHGFLENQFSPTRATPCLFVKCEMQSGRMWVPIFRFFRHPDSRPLCTWWPPVSESRPSLILSAHAMNKTVSFSALIPDGDPKAYSSRSITLLTQ